MQELNRLHEEIELECVLEYQSEIEKIWVWREENESVASIFCGWKWLRNEWKYWNNWTLLWIQVGINGCQELNLKTIFWSWVMNTLCIKWIDRHITFELILTFWLNIRINSIGDHLWKEKTWMIDWKLSTHWVKYILRRYETSEDS